MRSDPSFSEKPEWLQEFTENRVDERVPEPHDAHASVVPDKHSVYTSRKVEMARSVTGLKVQGPLAEDALVESHLAQKILVT